jgi:hypothetical protein
VTDTPPRHHSDARHKAAFSRILLAAGIWGSLGLAAPASAQTTPESQKILAADTSTGDFFAYSLAVLDGYATIGANQDDDNGLDSGSAYLFDLSIDAPFGAQVYKLLASDGAPGDRFGASIAFAHLGCGNTCLTHSATPQGIVVVGANGHDGIDSDSGAAYIFTAATGAQLHKLTPNDTAKNDFFGDSVATDAARVAVGAQGSSGASLDSGAVYVFSASTGSQILKLFATDGQTNDFFGRSIDLDNGLIVVGANGDDDNGDGSGSAYIFNASTGAQIHKLLPNDGAPFDHFGNSVAIDAGIVVVGSFSDDDNGSLSGSAYLFDAVTGLQIAKLVPNDGAVNELFGLSVAIDNGVVAVGAAADNDNGSNSGSAYLFKAASGAQLKKLLPSDGETGEQFGWSIAIQNDTVIGGAWKDDDRGILGGSAYAFDLTCPIDLNNDGVVDNGDITVFITLLLAQSLLVDFNGDGIIDNGDIIAFIALFLAGC